jgi:hypothetical protein
MQYHIEPVAAEAGIEIKGWHTLRQSDTTLLRQNNGVSEIEDVFAAFESASNLSSPGRQIFDLYLLTVPELERVE